MKKLFVSAFVAIVVLAAAAPAQAFFGRLNFANHSTSCAWVTVYGSDSILPWSILSSAQTRPRFVKPGESYSFEVFMVETGYTQAKVLVEIDKNANCTGGTVARMVVEKRGLDTKSSQLYTATLGGTTGRFTFNGE